MFTVEWTLVENDDFPKVWEFKVAKLNDYNYEESEKESKKKFRMMKIEGLGMPPVLYSDSGLPSVDTNVLKILC